MSGIRLLFKDGILKRWLMHLSGRFCMFEKNRITKISREDTEEGIPEWLLIELLIRLPANSVCRFKVVSKQWLSLISTPYFVHTYASRASSSPRWTFVSQIYHEATKCCRLPEHPLLTDLHSGVLKCPVAHRVSDKNLFARIYKVYGVSNGLVLYQCVSKDSRDGVLQLQANPNICNPIIKQCIVLPERFSGLNMFNGWGFLTNVEGGILRSYTVVVFVVHLSRFDVFYSEIGEWKSYTVSTDLRIDNFMLHRDSVDVDGILHLISPENGIITYDHQRNPDVLRVIAFPTDNPLQDQGRFRMCGTYQGCLRYLEYAYWTLSLCVWVLNDYGRGDNWCLQHWVNFKDDAVLDINIGGKRSNDISIDLKPIYFHPLDSDIVYFGDDTIFVSYHMRARKMQILKSFEDPKEQGRHIPWFRAVPLLIPPLPVSIPSSLRYLNCSHPQSHCS